MHSIALKNVLTRESRERHEQQLQVGYWSRFNASSFTFTRTTIERFVEFNCEILPPGVGGGFGRVWWGVGGRGVPQALQIAHW